MTKDLHQDIRLLEREIVSHENKIYKNVDEHNFNLMKKSVAIIHSDLKYLSIIINGAPLNPKENLKIQEFIRIHYENLRRLPLSV